MGDGTQYSASVAGSGEAQQAAQHLGGSATPVYLGSYDYVRRPSSPLSGHEEQSPSLSHLLRVQQELREHLRHQYPDLLPYRRPSSATRLLLAGGNISAVDDTGHLPRSAAATPQPVTMNPGSNTHEGTTKTKKKKREKSGGSHAGSSSVPVTPQRPCSSTLRVQPLNTAATPTTAPPKVTQPPRSSSTVAWHSTVVGPGLGSAHAA